MYLQVRYVLLLCLICFVFAQNGTNTDPYESYTDYIQSLSDAEPSYEGQDDGTPSMHFWHTDLLVTDGQCSEAGNVTWSTADNICNGTSYQSCMPEWPGIIHFKDLTPEDGIAKTIQFELFGSFGCGTNDGQVDYTLNGIVTPNGRYIYRSDFHCGCGELDTDPLNAVNLNDTKWTESYYPGDWNSFEIKSDPGVDICLCGITITGSYYGSEDPLDESSYSPPSGTGYLWAFATLFSLVLAGLIVAGVIYFYNRKKKLAAEADEFDVEFGE